MISYLDFNIIDFRMKNNIDADQMLVSFIRLNFDYEYELKNSHMINRRLIIFKNEEDKLMFIMKFM